MSLQDVTGAITETHGISNDHYNNWRFKVSEGDLVNGVDVSVVDQAGKEMVLGLG